MQSHLVAFCALVSMLSACATPFPAAYQAMPLAARDKIAPTDIVVSIPQSEVWMDVRLPGDINLAAIGGLGVVAQEGLLKAVQDDAKQALQPLNAALADDRLDEILSSELKASLSRISWVSADGFVLLTGSTSQNLEETVATSQANAVLTVLVSYNLTIDAKELVVGLQPRLLPVTDELRSLGSTGMINLSLPLASLRVADPEIAIYRDALTYRAGVPGATSQRGDNIALWAADDGAAIKVALQQGIIKLSAILAADLSTGTRPVDPLKMGLQPTTIGPIKGFIVRSDDKGRHLVNEEGGQIYLTNSSIFELQRKH